MNPVTIGSRLASMLLDHFIMTLIMVVTMVPFMIALITTDSNFTPAQSPVLMDKRQLYLMLLGMAVYLCKDCFGGRSIAKRIIKHQVLDKETLTPATPLQCLLRNFLIIFWPLEVIMVMINPAQRLGDRLARTIVSPYDSSRQVAPTPYVQLFVCLVLAYAYLLLITIPIH